MPKKRVKKLDDQVEDAILEREVVNVDSIAHEWKVLEKKGIGKVNYYLLQDYHKGKPKNLFNIIKESLEVGEKFTGRILDIPDAKRTVEREVIRADGLRGVKIERVIEPYIHRIMDVGSVTDEEAVDVFGREFKGITLVISGTEYKELLFTKHTPYTAYISGGKPAAEDKKDSK